LPLNRDFILRVVSDIREAVANARRLTSKSFDELGIYELLALRYLVIELVEAAAAACTHVLRELYGVYVEGYAACFERLARLNIIPQALAKRLAAAARLRNLLVHRYWEISDERVYRSVREGLRDFEEYAATLEALAGEAGAAPPQDHGCREGEASR
jgi:uncharacterized protein YutE (UPF0331/DUF86 family)